MTLELDCSQDHGLAPDGVGCPFSVTHPISCSIHLRFRKATMTGAWCQQSSTACWSPRLPRVNEPSALGCSDGVIPSSTYSRSFGTNAWPCAVDPADIQVTGLGIVSDDRVFTPTLLGKNCCFQPGATSTSAIRFC